MSVHKRGQTWEARWRVGTKQHSKGGFHYKKDAEKYEAQQRSRIKSHSFVPPKRAKVTLQELTDEWFDSLTTSERTRSDYMDIWIRSIQPQWASMRLEHIRPDEVTRWVRTLRKDFSPQTVRKTFSVFKQILDHAVSQERLTTNPAVRAKELGGKGFLPSPKSSKETLVLNHRQVADLAEASGPYRLMILVMAYTGVRFGEVTALQARDVEIGERRLHVRRAFTDIKGKLQLTTPKSGESRVIPIPNFLVPDLMTQLFELETPEDFLFTAAKGGPIRYRTWRKSFFDPAIRATDLKGLTPHALRKTYASLSIQAGVNPKQLQEALGHSDIRLTMDLYTSLYEADRDGHAARLSEAAETVFSEKCSQNVRNTGPDGTDAWSRLGDLNPGPTHYECVALPLS